MSTVVLERQFSAKIYPASNPAAAVTNSAAHPELSGLAWRFKDFSITGMQDLDEYRQYQQFGVGQRTGMTNTNSSTVWVYDRRGQTSQEKQTVGSDVFSTLWSYNAAGQPVTMSYPADNLGKVDEQVVFGYHPQGLLNSVVGTSSYVVGTGYDAAGRVDKRTLGNNTLKTGYEYFPWTSQGGRLEMLRSGTYANPTALQNLAYIYDLAGNVLEIDDWKAGSPQYQVFSYDGLNRLTGATAYNGSTGNYGPESYTYDPASGNLLTKTGTGAPGTYTYGEASHKHAVTATSNGWSFQYDANGNMTTRSVGSTYTLTYDVENRLTSVSGAGQTADFYYDGDGARVKATVGGVTTTYIGNWLEWSGSASTMKKYYYAGGARVAMRSSGTLYYLLGDHLGSTNVTATDTGARYAELRFKAWGEIRYTYGTTPTKRHFTGQFQEPLVGGGPEGLYFYGARWLDVSLGRWIQPDSLIPDPFNPLDFDRYSYVRSNPVGYNDPSGHMACDGKSTGDNCSSSKWRFTNTEIKEALGYEFQWQVEGEKWNYKELKSLYDAGIDILNYVNQATNGNGLEWMRRFLGGVQFVHGNLFGNSYELGGVIHLANQWIDDSEGPKYLVTHELAHLWDDRTGINDPLQPATWYGFGVSDYLAKFVGGRPNGFRFMN